MPKQTCEACGKQVKNLKLHLRSCNGVPNSPDSPLPPIEGPFPKPHMNMPLEDAIISPSELSSEKPLDAILDRVAVVAGEAAKQAIEQERETSHEEQRRIAREEFERLSGDLLTQVGPMLEAAVQRSVEGLLPQPQFQPQGQPAAQPQNPYNPQSEMSLEPEGKMARRGRLTDSVIDRFIDRLIKGDANPQGSSNFQQQLNQQYALFGAMLAEPMKMIGNFMTMALKGGAEPTQVADAMTKMGEDMTPKPPQQT